MLRVLVISLVVANLLLLGFQDSEPESRPEPEVTRVEEKDSGIPTIHLFSEMMQDQGLLSGNRQCFSLGPFHSIEDKDETRKRLLEVSTNISERQTEALVEKGYWVFMPPYESLLIANETLFSLQALGLKDIGIIYDGKWQSAISLGYFMRHENAQRRKESLEERGYEPLIRVQRQAEPRYWLDYEQTPGSGLIALDMQSRPNDFMQRALPCLEGDVFDLAQADSLEAVEELTQLQVPVEESSTTVTQDAVEALSIPSGGNEQEFAGPVRLGSSDDTGLEDTDETGQGSESGAEPTNADETGPEITIGAEPEKADEHLPETADETDPDGSNETGTQGNSDNETQEA